MEIIETIEQGTLEWLQLRCGMVTASNFGAVKSTGTTRHTYMMKLAAERITGEVGETFSNKAMEWGTANEPLARHAYEDDHFADVKEVAFIKVNDWVGVSPDGLVGDNGLIEIKCPNTNTHIETVLKGKMPTKHKPQVQGQLWASEREWCDFVSFDPRVPLNQLFVDRIYRDDTYIKALEEEINKFVDELQVIVHKFTKCEAA